MSNRQNSTDQWRNHPRRAELVRLSYRLRRLGDRREIPPSKEFTPTQAVILQAIKTASLRFEAHESTLLWRTLGIGSGIGSAESVPSFLEDVHVGSTRERYVAGIGSFFAGSLIDNL